MTSPPQRMRVLGAWAGFAMLSGRPSLESKPSAGARNKDRRVGVNRSAPYHCAGRCLVEEPDRARAVVGGNLSRILLGIVRRMQDGSERLGFIGAGGERQGMARRFQDAGQKSDSPLMKFFNVTG